jgi:uncharacterized membrane protein YqiK
MPGKYAFNTYAGSISMVPTTNIILKWIAGQSGDHNYDENLAEVNLITKDAFEPLLPLSVVIHIDYKKAPLVIQRFGDIKMLVNQTLDPMVSAYFKNIGQTRTLIELLQQRSDIQARSSVEMKEKFEHYNLELEEVLIGTPHSVPGDDKIEQILMQLRDRQVAVEKLETYEKQRIAADKERELRQANAVAQQQTMLTESEINVSIQENAGRAELQRATQDAERVKTLAGADAERIKLLAGGEAERIRLTAAADADKEARVGIGRAIAIEEQVRAYGGPQLQLIQEVMNRLSQAIEVTGIPIVPSTYVQTGGGSSDEGGTGANAFGLLMTLLATEKLQSTGAVGPVDPEQAKAAQAISAAIREQIAAGAQQADVAAAKTGRPRPPASTRTAPREPGPPAPPAPPSAAAPSVPAPSAPAAPAAGDAASADSARTGDEQAKPEA